MRTGIRRVTVAELHADTEAIIAELPHTEGIEIVSPEGELLAKIAPAPAFDLTPEQAAAVLHAVEVYKRTDPDDLEDISELMRVFDAYDENGEEIAPR